MPTPTPPPASAPTGIEKLVCEEIARRQQFGLNKYGVSVADNPLDLRQWLQHSLEECLDQAIYLRRAIQELDDEARWNGELPPQEPEPAPVEEEPTVVVRQRDEYTVTIEDGLIVMRPVSTFTGNLIPSPEPV